MATGPPSAEHVERLSAFNRKFMSFVPHNRALGIELVQLGYGEALMRLPYRADLIGNPVTGVLHGGAISALLDACSGSAVFMKLREAGPIATLDLRIDYLKPATPERAVLAYAECYRISRSVGFTRAVAYHDDRDAPIASSAGTFMLATPISRPPANTTS